MSMNVFMHPRNIYKQPPNFKQLALDYPEFRKHAKHDITGKVIIDFSNVEALRALTCTLLKNDFGLDVTLPLNKLIPTVPLRLNYILWIEDLLSVAGRTENIQGIDIGTGASCVYPLIAAKKNHWSMVATEIDSESLRYATDNVNNNNLQDLVKIFAVNGDTFLKELELESFDFCMCNPPFFATKQELHPFFKARSQNRPRPRNAFCASDSEVVAKGGEVEYITKLITESQEFKSKVLIYTTMVGHKSSLPPLKKLLRQVGVESFKQTEFCQGHTTRWGLAWTFKDIDLTKIPDSLIAAKQKLPKPLIYQLSGSYKLSYITQRLITILKELEIEYQEIKRLKHFVEFVITAHANTWSHQRRKKREKLRLSCTESEITSNLAEMRFTGSPPGKRTHDDDDDDEGFYNVKKLKTGDSSTVYLKAKIGAIEVDGVIGLELVFYEGAGTKEALHQVLQYLKNNLVKTDA